MIRSKTFAAALTGVVLGGAVMVAASAREYYMQWQPHDEKRPLPAVVEPGYPGTQEQVGKAPSDAIVLFDGSSTDAFEKANGEPIGWKIDDQKTLVIVKDTGGIQTKQSFGDMQLHVEWLIPESQAVETGQNRGNSGVFIMNQYEVQVLDCKDNVTYADGMAGGLYGQFPPLVNAGLGIDKWQNYDIIFRRPVFNEDGTVQKPAYVTVLHNGVVVQDNQELMGPCVYKKRTDYKLHADKLPLGFQNHHQIVHYRNIWVRELPPRIE